MQWDTNRSYLVMLGPSMALIPIPCEVHQAGLRRGASVGWTRTSPLFHEQRTKKRPLLLLPAYSPLSFWKCLRGAEQEGLWFLCRAFTKSGSKSPLPLSSFYTYFSLPFDSFFLFLLVLAGNRTFARLWWERFDLEDGSLHFVPERSGFPNEMSSGSCF